ncbi:archaetidylserine decarboxylase [Lentisphaerota bacterium ZTH]|nr:phosphatidylserine decarboxylase [Lentisphaerota bacterium]WET07090.1 archaetidylserine decarboxylase [Lentisphaerota bacterium ZTH]
MKKIEYIERQTGRIRVENPPGESYLKFLYHNPLGSLPLNLVVKRKLLSAFYGWLMKRKNSCRKIAPFVKQYGIDAQEALDPLKQYKSFNDFFIRKLKPSARPIQQGVTSPADGKILAFQNMDDIASFFVKGDKFTLEKFLRSKKLAYEYSNAAIIIVRLAPNDYHRFHFPYQGKASAPCRINGSCFSVSPYAVNWNFTRVFCENKRHYSLLKTADKGTILISPVGATMIGSIVETYVPESEVAKGDEMGYFSFGGSSILMLIDRGKVTIDADILKNTANGLETTVRMGETIGH